MAGPTLGLRKIDTAWLINVADLASATCIAVVAIPKWDMIWPRSSVILRAMGIAGSALVLIRFIGLLIMRKFGPQVSSMFRTKLGLPNIAATANPAVAPIDVRAEEYIETITRCTCFSSARGWRVIGCW